MILYTPLSAADIFPTEEQNGCNLIECNGRQLLARNMNDGNYQVEQLLSTDPADFLDAAYAPGAIIKG